MANARDDNHTACPDHPGHSFHNTMGFCSCGGSHSHIRLVSVPADKVIVHEKLSHGNYRHSRDVVLPADFTDADVLGMLHTSPYGKGSEMRHAEKVAAMLRETGSAYLGWQDWTIRTPEVSE